MWTTPHLVHAQSNPTHGSEKGILHTAVCSAVQILPTRTDAAPSLSQRYRLRSFIEIAELLSVTRLLSWY